jgi:single-strand DNA-binding protein
MSLSKTMVIGRLTKDPDVREINGQNGPQKVANFAVACDRDFGEGTDFYDVVVWRKLAENVERFLGKGRLVYVEGRMQKRTYTAKTPEGAEYPRDVWEIQADKVQFLDRGDNAGQGGQQGGQGNYQGGQQGNYQGGNQNTQQQSNPYGGNAPF